MVRFRAILQTMSTLNPRSLIVVVLAVCACQRPPVQRADLAAPIPDAARAPEASGDLPRGDQSADTGIDSALRAKIFAEVNAYLSADDPGAEPPLLDKLDGEYRGLPFSLFADAVQARPLPAALPAAGVHQADWIDPFNGNKEIYHVYVSPKLVAAAASTDRFPLVIFLHGAGGNGAAIAQDKTFQDAADRLGAILVAPTSHPNWNWAWDEEEMSQVVLLVQLLKRRFPVDDARVVLSGFSMGGWGSFSIGVGYADPLCGLVPVAGSVGAVYNTTDINVDKVYCCPHMENLKNLRLHYITGDQDMALLLLQNRACELCLKELGNEYVFTELKGQGHVFPPTTWEEAVTWTLAKPRASYPSTVVFNLAAEASSDAPGYFWLQNQLKTPQYWADIDARIDANKPARLQATLGANVISLVYKNVARASVYVAPTMVSGATPLKIVQGSPTGSATLWQGTVTLDSRFVITEARRRSERTAIFTRRIELDLPTP
jgi:predicted esterase